MNAPLPSPSRDRCRPGPRRCCAALLFPVLLLLASATTARAEPVTLLGTDLELTMIELRGIESGMISYFDQNKRLRAQPIDQSVRLVFVRDLLAAAPAAPSNDDNTTSDGDSDAEAEAPAEPVLRGRVTLTDGQVIAGQWLAAAAQGQAIRWRREGVGDFELPLAQLRSVVLGDAGQAITSTDGPRDVVVLNNGDRLTGFLTRFTGQSVSLQLPDNPKPVELPLARVAQLHLANPAEPAPATDYRVYLTDGTELFTSDLTLSSGELTFVPHGRSEAQRAAVPVDQAVAIDCLSRGYRLTELTALDWKQTGGGVVFGAPAPPRRAGADLRLHAPVTVEVALPEGAQRVAGLARLDLPPDTPLPVHWADFMVRFTTQSGESGRVAISAGNREQRFNFPVDGRTMRIELDAGVNGPVLDRLRLVRPMVLSRTATAEAD